MTTGKCFSHEESEKKGSNFLGTLLPILGLTFLESSYNIRKFGFKKMMVIFFSRLDGSSRTTCLFSYVLSQFTHAVISVNQVTKPYISVKSSLRRNLNLNRIFILVIINLTKFLFFYASHVQTLFPFFIHHFYWILQISQSLIL